MTTKRAQHGKRHAENGGLFDALEQPLRDRLLSHVPHRPDHFQPNRIVLAAGSLDTPERAALTERVLRLYPEAPVEYRLDTPHNRIPPVVPGTLERHVAGKRTLMLGVHRSAVRFAEERGNTCPNYWHFSPYGFCPYDCRYCYLAGTRSVYLSPAVKIFVNLPEIWREIDQAANRLASPTAFYLGKLQDALALEPLTGYVQALIPNFARHPFARLTLLTKAADVSDLVGAEHGGKTILSWSMTPPEIHARFEHNVPSPGARLAAMKQCAEAGYPVRVNLMPIIPLEGWQEIYRTFLEEMLSLVRVSRLTLGSICIYPDARALMERKLGRDNPISKALDPGTFRRSDRRQRFESAARVEIYRFLRKIALSVSSDLELGVCLEEPEVMAAAGFSNYRGKCNCVL